MTWIAPVFFEDLSEQDPADVCRRALCRYSEADACYALSVWGEEVRVFPREGRIERPVEKGRCRNELMLFAVHYLLHAKEIEPANEWVSEKDVPSGEAFFRGPHEVPTHLIRERFDGRLDAFQEKCLELDGVSMDMADSAYVFQIAPRIPVAVLYWQSDDEFPAESKLLYDKTISTHLENDIIYALAVGVCKVLSSA